MQAFDPPVFGEQFALEEEGRGWLGGGEVQA